LECWEISWEKNRGFWWFGIWKGKHVITMMQRRGGNLERIPSSGLEDCVPQSEMAIFFQPKNRQKHWWTEDSSTDPIKTHQNIKSQRISTHRARIEDTLRRFGLVLDLFIWGLISGYSIFGG
jgi:hypothetical protein